MFIEVNKNVKDKKRDNTGNDVRNPHSKKFVRDKSKIVSEMISGGEIKSARPWHKSSSDEAEFPGIDMTLLYMKGDSDNSDNSSDDEDEKKKKKKSKQAEIMIAEKYQDFMKRLGAKRLKDD